MKNSFVFGIGAVLLIGIISVGVVTAHGGFGMIGWKGQDPRDYVDMHDEVNDVFDSGTYADLEVLRDKYQMPVMYWIQSEEDFDLAQQTFERSDGYSRTGYRSMPCHGWN